MSLGGGGGGSSHVTQTTKVEAEPWSELPDLKRFWDEFIDMFWGEASDTAGGATSADKMSDSDLAKYLSEQDRKTYLLLKTKLAHYDPLVDDAGLPSRWQREMNQLLNKARQSAKDKIAQSSAAGGEGTQGSKSYRDMLNEDIGYIRDLFKTYDTQMSNLEQARLGMVSNAMNRYAGDIDQYVSELRGSKVPIRFGGKTIFNLTPRSVRNTLAQELGAKRERMGIGTTLADEMFRTYATPLQREYSFWSEHTPNEAAMKYLDTLKQMAMYGQNLRRGLSSQTQTAKISGGGPGVMQTIGNLATTGSMLYGLGKGLGLFGASAAPSLMSVGGMGAASLADIPAGVSTAGATMGSAGLGAVLSNPATWAIGLPLLLGGLFS